LAASGARHVTRPECSSTTSPCQPGTSSTVFRCGGSEGWKARYGETPVNQFYGAEQIAKRCNAAPVVLNANSAAAQSSSAMQKQSYSVLARRLAESAPTLAAFFDGSDSVLVMADDPAVRTNRLHLLAVLRNQAAVLADFSRLAG
jgi:hypothetical protein